MLLWGKAQGLEVNPVTAFSVSQWMDLGDKLFDSATQGSKEATELLTTWRLLLDTLKELKQQQDKAEEGDGLLGSPGPDSEKKARLSTAPTPPVTKDSSKLPKSILSDTDKDPRHFLGKLKGVKEERTYVWPRDQKQVMKDSYTYVWPRDQIKAMKDSHEKTALGYVRSREGALETPVGAVHSAYCSAVINHGSNLSSAIINRSSAVCVTAIDHSSTLCPAAISCRRKKMDIFFFPIPPCLEI